MPAHLRDIARPRCIRCGKPATVQLYSTYNEALSCYCKTHGNEALNQRLRNEQAHEKGR